MGSRALSPRNLVNLGLLALVVLLGLLAFWPAGEEPRRLLPLERDQLTHISIRMGEKPPIVLQKQPSGWALTQPIARDTEQSRVAALLSIVDAQPASSYGLGGLDLKEFQLDPPLAVLALNGQTLEFGGTDPVNRHRYVRLAEQLHLLADLHYPLLASGINGFANLKLVPRDSTIVALTTPYAQVRRQGEGWADAQSDALLPLAQDWVHAWENARAAAIEGHSDQRDEEGEGEVIIELADGTVQTFSVAQGKSEWALMPADANYRLRLLPDLAAELLRFPVTPPSPGAN
jgi:hypothetical protein